MWDLSDEQNLRIFFILSVSIPLCFINVLDIFITVNTTNN
jgi:hypothetical protein